MSVNIVLPTLSVWAADRLTSVLESKTQADFDTAFDATFSANCQFNLNGKSLSREAYRSQLQGESAAAPFENSTTVQVEGHTEVEIGGKGQLSGLVGLFYTALSESKFLVLGAPSQKTATSSVNLTIEPTEKNPQEKLHIRGYFDPRRVTSVNQVAAESTYHVTIPTSAIPKTASTTSNKSKVELGPGNLPLPPNFLGPFGGIFEPGPVLQRVPSGVRFWPGPGSVNLPAGETGAKPEQLPGFGAFGVGPAIASGETLGDSKA